MGARRKRSSPSWKAGGGVFVILGAPAVGESGEAAGHLGRTEHLTRMHVSVRASLPQLLPHRLTLGFSDSKRLYLILLCLYPFYLHFTKYSSMGGRGRKLCRAEVETRQSFGAEK